MECNASDDPRESCNFINKVIRSCILRCLELPSSIQLATIQLSLQFDKVTIIHGRNCRVLYDTGASVSFVQRDHPILKQATLIRNQSNMDVTLGDGSVVQSKFSARLDFDIDGHSHNWEYNVMDLPNNIDLIVGMDFMRAHDVILHTAEHQVLFGPSLLVMGQQTKAPEMPKTDQSMQTELCVN